MTVSVHNNNHHFHLQIPHFHHHHHHHDDQDLKGVPKGCMAVMVGTHAEEQKRFVIPVMYINHPLFIQLLKEAEEEFGFDQKGPITIPCHVEAFRAVQILIDKEIDDHHARCFRVLFHHHHHHQNREY